MTTAVNVLASHSTNKEVIITVLDNGEVVEQFTIQDQETALRYVYDKRCITISEREKI